MNISELYKFYNYFLKNIPFYPFNLGYFADYHIIYF